MSAIYKWTKKMQAVSWNMLSQFANTNTHTHINLYTKDIKIKHTDHIERNFHRIWHFNWFRSTQITPFILIVCQNGIFVFPKNWLFPCLCFFFQFFIFTHHIILCNVRECFFVVAVFYKNISFTSTLIRVECN